MVTATFPSSRLARFEHGTGPATPSQVTRGDGVCAVHPGLALVVEKFHRDEQPACGLPYETHELHAAPVPVGSLADEIGVAQHVGDMPEAEVQPGRATGGDVEQALARDVNGSLCAHQSTGQPDVTGDNAGDLDRVGVGAKGGPACHAARNVSEDPPSRRTSLMHG